MLTTRFTALVGCTVPIQQAPIGELAAAPLIAAVNAAGALGMFGAVEEKSPATLVANLDDLRARTPHPFGINFLMPWVEREKVAIAARRARVVEFFYGAPDPMYIDLVHDEGALACWQVGARAEAVAAEAAGCDLIAVQGVEAGGHVRGTVALLPLLAEVLDAVSVPVIAAGGIATGRGMAAALAAGADAVRVGTRFVVAAEAEAHPTYVAALIAASAEETALTETFSAHWRHAPHRTLRASVAAAERFEGAVVGERLLDGAWVPVDHRSGLAIPRTARGAVEAMPHWAGQSVGAVRRVQPAGEIVRELAEEAERLLRRW